MSSYENYDRAAAGYDGTRWPIGVEIILGCLAQAPRPLHEQAVLDAGCGTGNYAQALLRHVGRIEGVDLSEGMLAMAQQKLADALEAGRVRMQRGSIAELPLADAAVDGAMVNQVLHHLPDEPDAGWPMHRKVIGELARVLAPGGVLVVNSCSEEQLARGFWAASFVPRASELMARRIMPLHRLEAAMAAAGIEPRGRFVPVDALVQGPGYLDPRGPLRTEWRAGDSLWALAGANELAEMERTLRALDAAGELEARVAELDAPRRAIGQITLVYGIKR